MTYPLLNFEAVVRCCWFERKFDLDTGLVVVWHQVDLYVKESDVIKKLIISESNICQKLNRYKIGKSLKGFQKYLKN